jgi:SAM-dependent methyltransferase
MDWTGGYASDIEYTAGFYQEQSPAFLNFVSVLNGAEPVDTDRPFTYFELGFGRGLTLNLLAAAYPQGQFYGADFNPSHVAGAQSLAGASDLKNIVLLEDSFEDLAKDSRSDLPRFDFITLHGIYTWVNRENQQHIVKFIQRYLKPGGLVYLSYNAMPGWSAALPLQRLLIEYAEAYPGRSDKQVQGGAAFVKSMEAASASYFDAHPNLKLRLEMIQTKSPNYLVHEYMHRQWMPLYHADVARDLSAAKLEFVGSAELPMTYTKLYLSDERQKVIETLSDPVMKETLKDYFLNSSFRKDVFVRGKRKLNSRKQIELILNTGVMLLVPQEKVSVNFKFTVGELNGKAELFSPLIAALQERPHRISELVQLPAMNGQSLSEIVQAVVMLVSSAQCMIYGAPPSEGALASSRKMNHEIARLAVYDDEFQALVSPLLQALLPLNHVERLVYFALTSSDVAPDVDSIVNIVWSAISGQERRMMRKGVPLDTVEENLAEVKAQVLSILQNRLSVWDRAMLR